MPWSLNYLWVWVKRNDSMNMTQTSVLLSHWTSAFFPRWGGLSRRSFDWISSVKYRLLSWDGEEQTNTTSLLKLHQPVCVLWTARWGSARGVGRTAARWQRAEPCTPHPARWRPRGIGPHQAPTWRSSFLDTLCLKQQKYVKFHVFQMQKQLFIRQAWSNHSIQCHWRAEGSFTLYLL